VITQIVSSLSNGWNNPSCHSLARLLGTQARGATAEGAAVLALGASAAAAAERESAGQQ